MNRIESAYSRMKLQVEQRIEGGQTTQEKADATCEALDMQPDEHAKFQELKSEAVSSGSLSCDEGVTIYASLGNTVGVFNRQPVWVKAVLTGVFKELLQARIGA